MASITGTGTAVNGSGTYRMEIFTCTGTSVIYEDFIGSINGSLSHTITDAILAANLGYVKVQIRDLNIFGVLSESPCFNHNCSTTSSISSVTGSSNC